MKLKRFNAPDTKTAMQQIKAVFGPDAVILSTHQVEGGVEIVAAIDFDESVITPEYAIEVAEPASSKNEIVRASPLDDMKQEIQTLRGLLEAQLRGAVAQGNPLQTLVLQKLLYLGVSPAAATAWSRRVDPSMSQHRAWQHILSYISEQLPIQDIHRIEEGGIYAFVGPTGVGKTTTLAKIAARFCLRFGADKLGLVTMDTYRIAAQEQLILYGKIFGINVCVAEDEVSLSRVLRQLSDKKLILIDTAGMNPKDERVKAQMDVLGEHLQSISKVLVLSATSHYQVVHEAIQRYSANQINQAVITKVDESMAIGGVLSAIIEHRLPISYLTHGQRVPEDIKMATRHQLIEVFSEQERLMFKDNQESASGLLDVGSVYHV